HPPSPMASHARLIYTRFSTAIEHTCRAYGPLRWTKAQNHGGSLWTGRWESNCIPNPKVWCFDGVAALFTFKWSQVESNSLCWLGSVPLPDCELVGAPRFELGTSCAQGRRNISWKSFRFNLSFENKRVRKIFGSGTMYTNVAAHAWSPPNFPHSEITAKVRRSVPTS